MTAIDQLTQQIASTGDPLERACLSARRATYLAREGEFDLARQICRNVRNEFAGSSPLTLTCWLCLLEGVILFYDKPDSDAFDRVRRSYHLSRSMLRTDVGVWSTAWLSHLEFNRGRLTESANLCSEVLNTAQPIQFGPLSRVALTLADTFNYCGIWGQAAEWYSRARRQALSDGDRTAVSAVLHNVAALRVHTMRLSRFCGCVEPSGSDWVELELDSSKNYDVGIGVLSLGSLQPVLRAQLLILGERFSEALEVLDSVESSLEDSGLRRYQPLISVDRLLCQVKLGIAQDFDSTLASVNESLLGMKDHDDLAIALGVLSEICILAHNSSESERFRALSMEEVAKYKSDAILLSSRLSELGLLAEKWSHLYR